MVDAHIEAALATNLLEAGLKGEPCAFFLLDENNRFLWVFNPFGGLYDPTTMMGRSDRELGMPQEMVRSMKAMIERVRQTGSSEQTDIWVKAPAGERRCFVVHYQLYPLYNGQRCVLGRAREITGQRLAEEKDRQSNLERKARLRELEETSLLLWKAMEGENTSLGLLDEDLRYVRILNPFPEYPAEYLIGKTDVEVLDTEEARQGMALKRQVLETGKSLTTERWMSFALGERRFVVSHYIPITLASGRPGLMVKVSDRTEETLAEQNQRDLNKALALKVGELEQSERRLSAALEGQDISLILHDENLRILWAFNPPAAWVPENLVGKTVLEIGLKPEDARLTSEYLSRVLETGETQSFEFWVELPNGERRYNVVTYLPFDLGQGRRGILGRNLNLTQQKLREEEFQRRSQERETQLARLDQAEQTVVAALKGQPISLVSYNEDLRIQWHINTPPVWGGTTLEGKSVLEMDLDPDQARHLRSLQEHTLATGEPTQFEGWLVNTNQGRTYVRINYDQFYSATGKAGVLSRILNLTEQKQREQELATLNQTLSEKVAELDLWDNRMRLALRDMPVSLYLQDEDTRFIWCYNPSPPWTEESLIGRSQFEIGLTREDAEAINANTAHAKQTGKPYSVEYWVGHPDGLGSTFYRSTYEPISLGNGKVGILTKALDLTQEKRAEQKLASLNQTLSQKLAELAMWENRLRHSLKDTPISLYLQEGDDLTFIWCYNPTNTWTADALLGKKQLEIDLPPDQARAVFERKSQVLRTGKPFQEESVLLNPKTGESVCFRVSYEPFDLGNGQTGVLTKAIDITEDKLAAQKVADLADNLAQENARVSELLTQVKSESDFRLSQLREASEMQKAFLPADLMVAGPYTIAASMTTSIEVGGDYYDYSQDGEALTVVIGDATGHGVRAGIMVALVKSYFASFGASLPPQTFLASLDAHLERMRFKQLYMGLSAFRLEDGLCTYAVAGMPPFFWYHAASGSVERLAHKGLFLGAGLAFQYKEHTLTLEPGDILVLASDGLTEAFDPEGEMLPFQPIRNSIEQAGQAGPQAVVNSLIGQIREWTGKVAVDDDLTILALRYEGQ